MSSREPLGHDRFLRRSIVLHLLNALQQRTAHRRQREFRRIWATFFFPDFVFVLFCTARVGICIYHWLHYIGGIGGRAG